MTRGISLRPPLGSIPYESSPTRHGHSLLPPTSITCLDIELRAPLSSEELDSLPTGLLALKCHSFDLNYLETLQQRLTACWITITEPIQLLSPDALPLRQKFESLLAPVLDANRLLEAVCGYAQRFRTRMTLDLSIKQFTDIPTVKTLIYDVACSSTALCSLEMSLMDSNSMFKASIETLILDNAEFSFEHGNADFALLTTVNLGNCIPKTKCHLPPALTHLTAYGAYYTPPDSPPPRSSLRFLDAPNWTFTHSFILKCNFNHCEMLKCIISQVPDTEVETFLINKFSPQTRFNMLVSLSVVVTGALVPNSIATGPQFVDYDALSQITIESLVRDLSRPIASSLPSNDPLLPETNLMSSVAKIFRYERRFEDDFQFALMIPFSATAVSLTAPTGWSLSKNPQHTNFRHYSTQMDLDDANDGFSRPSLFARSILTRLELIGIDRVEHLWNSLPSSLEVLRIEAPDALLTTAYHLPGRLHTLILIQTSSTSKKRPRTLFSNWELPSQVNCRSSVKPNADTDELAFSLCKLPTTLRHLVLVSQTFVALSYDDVRLSYAKAKETQLFELRTVIPGEIGGWGGQLMRLLPLHQLDRFEYVTRPIYGAQVTTFTYPPTAKTTNYVKVFEMVHVKTLDLSTLDY